MKIIIGITTILLLAVLSVAYLYFSNISVGSRDNDKALALLGNMLLPAINMFCYGECSSGQELFMYEMAKRFNLNSNKGSDIPRKKIRTSTLLDDDDILEVQEGKEGSEVEIIRKKK